MLDPVKLAEIWDLHADRLLLIARSIGGPADDAVQEAFVSLAKQREMPDDAMAWLTRVTRNHLLQWQRSRRRRQRREWSVYEKSWFDNEVGQIDRAIDGDEVTKALLEIDSPEREIIVMHLWGELTFDSIARVLGISRATAHRSFGRGLEALRKQFNTKSPSDTRLCHD